MGTTLYLCGRHHCSTRHAFSTALYRRVGAGAHHTQDGRGRRQHATTSPKLIPLNPRNQHHKMSESSPSASHASHHRTSRTARMNQPFQSAPSRTQLGTNGPSETSQTGPLQTNRSNLRPPTRSLERTDHLKRYKPARHRPNVPSCTASPTGWNVWTTDMQTPSSQTERPQSEQATE